MCPPWRGWLPSHPSLPLAADREGVSLIGGKDSTRAGQFCSHKYQHAQGVGMSEVREIRGPRGIQQQEVFDAADRLLAEGLRPTIERVRQKIGRGSPNTVSPMLERWFASLGERLAAGPAPGALVAGNDADGVPVSARNAARLLWETARREADEIQRQEMEAAHTELQQAQEALK